MPVTIPVPVPTLATGGRELFHVPPAGELANVVDEPTQITNEPVIGDGDGLTDNIFVAVHPPRAYDMVTTPAASPVTTPVEPIDAIVGALLDHAPPGGVATYVMEDPTHTEVLPEIPAPDVTDTVVETLQPVGRV
jgi:hypothetical protein